MAKLVNVRLKGKPSPPAECTEVEFWFDRFYQEPVLLFPDGNLWAFNSGGDLFRSAGWLDLWHPELDWREFLRISKRFEFQGEWK